MTAPQVVVEDEFPGSSTTGMLIFFLLITGIKVSLTLVVTHTIRLQAPLYQILMVLHHYSCFLGRVFTDDMWNLLVIEINRYANDNIPSDK